jgi:hypothetical protein
MWGSSARHTPIGIQGCYRDRGPYTFCITRTSRRRISLPTCESSFSKEAEFVDFRFVMFPRASVTSVYIFPCSPSFSLRCSQYLVIYDPSPLKFRLLFICDLGLVVTVLAKQLMQARCVKYSQGECVFAAACGATSGRNPLKKNKSI